MSAHLLDIFKATPMQLHGWKYHRPALKETLFMHTNTNYSNYNTNHQEHLQMYNIESFNAKKPNKWTTSIKPTEHKGMQNIILHCHFVTIPTRT